VSGPYETERDAITAARHILDSPPGTGAWQDGSLRLLEGACGAAQVKLGAYDHRILVWLAGWEPQLCAVTAGLISRAGNASGTLLSASDQATVLDALAAAAEYRRYRTSLTCQACAEHPAELCEDHQADLDAAEAYEDLTARLGGAR
jgi:hypothetical protein